MSQQPLLTPRIAVFGGSFDPFHHGHGALINLCCHTLNFTKLLLIPAGNPWQKAALRTTGLQRYAMLQQAYPSLSADISTTIELDDREIQRSKPSYTVDTLTELRAEYGHYTSLSLLLGADQLARLSTWHQWQKLFDLAHLCIVARPGYSLDESTLPPAVRDQIKPRQVTPAQLHQKAYGQVVLLPSLAVDISSTHIRHLIAQGIAPLDLIDQAVLDYIHQHQLYTESTH